MLKALIFESRNICCPNVPSTIRDRSLSVLPLGVSREDTPDPWRLAVTESLFEICFSDGKPINDIRGGDGTSFRLNIDQQGFLDLIELLTILDTNGSKLVDLSPSEPRYVLQLSLKIPGDKTFTLELINEKSESRINLFLKKMLTVAYYILGLVIQNAEGNLKPFPEVSDDDANYIEEMIQKKYVPYQNIPEERGKTDDEIRE